MFEQLMTPLLSLEKDNVKIGYLTTDVCTSHYGQAEWSGCSVDLVIGDKVTIADPNGGPPWIAKVVGVDEIDGWLLVYTEECDAEYYCIHPLNGWLTCLDPAYPQVESDEELVARINAGECKLQGVIRIGDGWGCV